MGRGRMGLKWKVGGVGRLMRLRKRRGGWRRSKSYLVVLFCSLLSCCTYVQADNQVEKRETSTKESRKGIKEGRKGEVTWRTKEPPP
jgi:hypothetical protein